MVYSDLQKTIHDRRKDHNRRSKQELKEKSKDKDTNKSPSLNGGKSINKSINNRSITDFRSNFFKTSYAEKVNQMTTEEFVENVKD